MDNNGMRTRAFTLIEMALVLILFGVLISTALPKLFSQIKTDKVKKSKEYVTVSRDEIVGYALVHGGMLPTQDSTGAVPVVPATLLGQPSGLRSTTDSWGEPITYLLPAVDATGGTLTANSVCDFDATTMTLTTPDGTTVNDVAFLLASKGLNLQNDLGIVSGANSIDVTQQAFGASSAVNAGLEFDDVVDFVTLDYLKNKLDCASGGPTPPSGTGSIDFTDMANDFPAPTTSTTASESGVISIDPNTQEMLVLNPSSGVPGNPPAGGCIFYQGSSGTCVADDDSLGGVCQLGNGFRAYFRYAYTNNPNGGMVFVIPGVTLGASGTNNHVNTLCGDYGSSQDIGYAGTSGASNVIDDPKIGIEFDLQYHGTANDPTDGGGASTRNHFGVVFWGAAGDPADDNTHNISSIGQPTNPTTGTTVAANTPPDTDGLYYNSDNGWLESTGNFRMELEVIDASTGEIEIRAWYNCVDSNCNDLSDDLSNLAPTAVPTVQYSPPPNSRLQSQLTTDPFYLHRVGWSFVFNSNNESVTISDFELTWR